MIYTALAAAALVAGVGIWKVKKTFEKREQDAVHRAWEALYQQRIADINRLSLPEAREQVLAMLTDTSRFTCVPATTPLDSTHGFLAPELHAFFTRFESVRTTGFETILSIDGYEITVKKFVLDRSLIRPVESDEFAGFVSGDWTDCWHIGQASRRFDYVLVKADDEALFDADEYDCPESIQTQSRTIYHWILWIMMDRD